MNALMKLRRLLAAPWVTTVFRIIVGGLFIYAGVVKILDPLSFAENVHNYRLVGRTLSFFTALYLPWLEAVAGSFLVVGLLRRASSGIISALLAFFIVLTVITMIRGINVDCGCFGALSRKAGLGLLVEDGIMLLMSLHVLFAPPARPRV